MLGSCDLKAVLAALRRPSLCLDRGIIGDSIHYFCGKENWLIMTHDDQ